MLTRPLAYKGPADHLTQYFELPKLYQGILCLSQDCLMDWQRQKQEGQKQDNQIQGVFFHQGKLIKTLLAWPLSSEVGLNHCGCDEFIQQTKKKSLAVQSQSALASNELIETTVKGPACQHLAALAIETKTRLDRLPQSLKQTETHRSEWQYLTHWIAGQHFDPFPNMARHRVIYILEPLNDELQRANENDAAIGATESSSDQINGVQVSVFKAYLTQQNDYQKKAELDLTLVNKDKLPKFFSLTDQQIIHQLNQLRKQDPTCAIGTHETRLTQSTEFDAALLQKNWQQGHFKETDVHDLLKKIALSGRCFWRACHRQPLSFEQHSNLKPNWSYLGAQLFLDRAKSRVISITQHNDEEVERFLQLTAARSDGQPQNPWQACLSISSEQVVLPFTNQAQEIDVAKVSFCCESEQGVVEVSLQRLMAYCYHTSKRNNSIILEAIASKIHQLDWLESLAANFEQPVCQQFDICDRYLKGNLAHWLPLFRGLQLEGWQVRFLPQFRLNQKRVEHWYSKIVQPNSAKNQLSQSAADQKNQQVSDWFDLEVGIKVDGQAINLMPYIIKSLQQGLWDFSISDTAHVGTDNEILKPSEPEFLYLTLDDGTRVELAYRRVKNILNALLELYESSPLTDEQRLRLPTNQFSRLLKVQNETGNSTEWQQAEWLKQKVDSLSQGPGVVQVKVPVNVQANLRDYQKQGLNWLQFLARESLSGILADDMGLGKTLQTLAHIQCEKNAGRMQGPCLVVAPTSLLGNWYSEARKFTPELKLVYWAGANRHRFHAELSEADLIITSYGLLLRDATLLNQHSIHLLILDEAQAIKNSRSKISKIAFALTSKYRLCLTGTPLENHLGELWSLFHFLMPGFLGDENQFKKIFRIPIEKEQDYTRQLELADRISPFMLRRSKEKVAADLPAKTVIEELIDLTESQADVYETVRLSMYEEVQKAIANSGVGRNQMLIGNALLRLRQICCHPQLISDRYNAQYEKEEVAFVQADLFDSIAAEPTQKQTKSIKKATLSSFKNSDSAKLTWLKTTLPEMIQNGRKVLIFSSFTSMLSLIETLLKKLSIEYLTLTGKTRNRSNLVEQFQQGKTPVFLISLKAGGAGLNLTQADTVIHFDPWWNPAAENQASDRAHRIGQDKPVFVYKLITKGTVEERINQMQQRKSGLASDLYKQSEKQALIEQPDWQQLLAPLVLD